jgi:hypothetical protein
LGETTRAEAPDINSRERLKQPSDEPHYRTRQSPRLCENGA